MTNYFRSVERMLTMFHAIAVPERAELLPVGGAHAHDLRQRFVAGERAHEAHVTAEPSTGQSGGHDGRWRRTGLARVRAQHAS